MQRVDHNNLNGMNTLCLRCNIRVITMQTNRMIWEILFSDIDLNIFKNKKDECYVSLQKMVLSNYILMFFFLNNYIATPLITIQRTIYVSMQTKKNHKH